VGDDDQSIYKFRGASVSNILTFKKDNSKAKQITLIENYRSNQNILDLAYSFIQANNPDRLEVKLKINKRLKSTKKTKGGIEVVEADDLSGELNSVARKIVELKNLPTSSKDTSWNDFAVLIRSNSAAVELLPILSANDIPHTFVANKGLYKKPIILDMLSFMRLLDNTYDSSALYRVLNLPKFHLEHEEISALLEHAKQKTLSLYESLTFGLVLPGISQKSKEKIKKLKDYLLKHYEIVKNQTAVEAFVEMVKDLGVEQKLQPDTLENSENRELLDQFYKKIEAFEKQSEHKSLHSFLEHLNLELSAGSEGEIKFDPNLGPESVKILTIHSAKGLEFKHVFIVNLVDQRFPTRQKKEAIEIPEPLVKDILPEGNFHLQEERRLFYVGITRAKESLFLTWAKDYGGKILKKPSQFLIETSLVPSDKTNKATGKVFFNKPGKQDIVYKHLPNRFSYSAINDFKSCPLAYKYKHYLKLPLRGSHHQSFGITMHKVFEEFLKIYKNNQALKQTDLFGKNSALQPLPEEKNLLKLYEQYWVDDWYEDKQQKEEYKKLGLKMLNIFYSNLADNMPRPALIEQFFKLKLPAKGGPAPGGGYEFVGKIDRADETPSGLSIIDYKTGKTPKTKSDLDQLYVYQWAAQDFLGLKVGELKYWYLQENIFKSEKLAEQTEIHDLQAKLVRSIEEIIEAIKYDKFKELHKFSPKHYCEFENLEA